MGLFIFIGTISKILNRRIERKIDRLRQLRNLDSVRLQDSFNSIDLSLLSVNEISDAMKETDINEASFNGRATSSN